MIWLLASGLCAQSHACNGACIYIHTYIYIHGPPPPIEFPAVSLPQLDLVTFTYLLNPMFQSLGVMVQS
jgi:hypothetical protein